MDNGKIELITKKIKVYGIVQGVGFRPLVYRIAKKLEIKGNVRNVGGYVEITAQASLDTLDLFIKELQDNHENNQEVIKVETEEIPYEEWKDFIIINSKMSEEISILPPDLPTCPECQKELYEEKNRQFHNPFISCMSCGPRYTIIEELPYDRQNTTMKDFKMCDSCQDEYTSPESRRFHAQTISCNDCGPYLIFHPMEEETKPLQLTEDFLTEDFIDQEAFEKAVTIIKAGGILAVKGIGGYHFVCSPFIEETVQNLRRLKGREEKPFAVMFPSLQDIKNFCQVSEEESALLNSKARPIVLLYMHNDSMAFSTNKGSIYCGAFLPYTPLQLLLTRQCGPLIMTSANISNQPIIKEDDVILSVKSPYLNGVLYNTRRIVRSVEDSVAKMIDGKPQLIRRSRGYVPYPVFINQTENSRHYQQMEIISEDQIDRDQIDRDQEVSNQENRELLYSRNNSIFSAGGDLKAAFTLYKNGNAVVSQYFGDLEEASVMEEYKKSFTDLSRLLKITPTLAVCDMHPNYHSVRFAKTLGIPILEVQHHHAHIASVMAEYDLRKRVIGISFDGTGYGTDGNIWGGEFLICEGAEFIRGAHLSYTLILGGDGSMKDAKKTATCYLLNAGLDKYVTDERRELIKTALEHKINTVLTSSMGRLFDAVAAILTIGQENRYEGECAAALEREAVLAFKNQIEPEALAFAICEKGEIIELEPRPVLEALCQLRETKEIGALALGFHYALAKAIGEICDRLRVRYHSNTAALSGGVSQNSVLTEQTLKILRQKGFDVYVNMAVPPNDGGISLGQTYIGMRSYIKDN